MLEELAKQDKHWRILALSICNDPYLADDLVHDMYIKLHNKEFELTPVYVYLTIKSIFRDMIKQNRFVDNEFMLSIEQECGDKDILEQRKHLNEILNHLAPYDREVLLMTSEMSLRECAEKLNEIPLEGYEGVSYMWFHHRRKSALKKLKKLLNGNK